MTRCSDFSKCVHGKRDETYFCDTCTRSWDYLDFTDEFEEEEEDEIQIPRKDEQPKENTT